MYKGFILYKKTTIGETMDLLNATQSDFKNDPRLRAGVKSQIKKMIAANKKSEKAGGQFLPDNQGPDSIIAAVYITQNLEQPEFKRFATLENTNALLDLVGQTQIVGAEILRDYKSVFYKDMGYQMFLDDMKTFDSDDYSNEPIRQISGLLHKRPGTELTGSVSAVPPVLPDYDKLPVIEHSDTPDTKEAKHTLLANAAQKVAYSRVEKPTAEDYDIAQRALEDFKAFAKKHNLSAGNSRQEIGDTSRGFGVNTFIGRELRQKVKNEVGEEHDVIIGLYSPITKNFTMPASQEANPIAYEAQAKAAKMNGFKDVYFNSVPEPKARGEQYITNMVKALQKEGYANENIHIPNKYAHLRELLNQGQITANKPVEPQAKPEPTPAQPAKTVVAESIKKHQNHMFLVKTKPDESGEDKYLIYGLTEKSSKNPEAIRLAIEEMTRDNPELLLKIKGAFLTTDMTKDLSAALEYEKPFKEAYSVLRELQAVQKAIVANEIKPVAAAQSKAEPQAASDVGKQALEAMKKRRPKP